MIEQPQKAIVVNNKAPERIKNSRSHIQFLSRFSTEMKQEQDQEREQEREREELAVSSPGSTI